jgi:hypothetical protein
VRYANLDQLKAYSQISDTVTDDILEVALDAAEDLIDRWCRRTFTPPETGQRIYEPASVLRIDDLTELDTVEAQTSHEGAWSEVSRFELLPLNDIPKTHIRFSRLFAHRVRVTGKFGWPEPPPAVTQAAVIQASRLAQRRNAAFGIATLPGLDGTGMRLLSKLDADVELLLQPFRRDPVLV